MLQWHGWDLYKKCSGIVLLKVNGFLILVTGRGTKKIAFEWLNYLQKDNFCPRLI